MVSKNREVGIRYSSVVQEAYFKKYNTTYLKSHGAIMRGYITITQEMWQDTDLLVQLLNDSYDYVMSLDTK